MKICERSFLNYLDDESLFIIIMSPREQAVNKTIFKMIRNALGAWFPAKWFILRIIFSEIIADNKEEESEEMLAPGGGCPGSAQCCLCDTKEKYFIHLTRGSPLSAASTTAEGYQRSLMAYWIGHEQVR